MPQAMLRHAMLCFNMRCHIMLRYAMLDKNGTVEPFVLHQVAASCTALNNSHLQWPCLKETG